MSLKVSKRSDIYSFIVMDVMQRAAELQKREGKEIIHLEVGQPSTAAPLPAQKAMIDAMREPASHGYALSLGQGRLRRGIADHYRRSGVAVEPGSIIVTVGSSLGFLMSFTACFDPGDVVAMTNPGYSAYRNLMVACGLEPMLIELSAEDGWRFGRRHLDALGKAPDGLVMASPANPTGVVMTRDEVRGVVEWCAENGVRLVSDEIYHGITYGVDATSVLEFTRDAVIVNSFSKFFSMTGHRVGWAVVPGELEDRMGRLAQNMVISVPTLPQIAATAAITDPAAIEELEGHVERYRRNRDILLEGLDPRLLNNAAPPEGAFYLYLDTSRISPDSVDLANRLLDEAFVATTPGIDFDTANGGKALRLSFAGTEDDMSEAVRRINSWVEANA